MMDAGDVNGAPSADGLVVTTEEDTAVTFEGRAADPDGDMLSYSVEDMPVNGTVTVDGASFTYEPTPDFNGVDTFTYRASDGELDSNAAVVSVHVGAVDDPPIAEVGEDQTFDVRLAGMTVQLDGRASHDPDGESLQGVSWEQTGGPFEVELQGPLTTVPRFTLPGRTGAYEFELTVKDRSGATATAATTIHVVDLAAALGNTGVVSSTGILTTRGSNSGGRLGAGDGGVHLSPVEVAPSETWSAVALGDAHSAAIHDDGTLWTWGLQFRGALGTDAAEDEVVSAPDEADPGEDWVDVHVGQHYTLALRSDGTVWGWGANDFGQLGDGTTEDRPAKVQLCSRIDGSGACIPLSDVVALSVGRQHNLALRADGALFAWGDPGNGRLGLSFGAGTPSEVATARQVGSRFDWADIAAGDRHSLALREDGTLWAWGQNTSGQLGDGTTEARTTPVPIAPDDRWLAIAGGRSHSLALRSDGTLWAWGDNANGQLGTGDTEDATTPVQVCVEHDGSECLTPLGDVTGLAAGASHSVAVTRDGTVYGFGGNSSGQAGAAPMPATEPQEVAGISAADAVEAGSGSSFVQTSDGNRYVWGANANGQLGTGSRDPITEPRLVEDGPWAELSAGASFVLGLQSDASLWAWGFNNSGRLGDGTTTSRLEPVSVAGGGSWLTASAPSGGSLAVGIQDDGTLWRWGRDIVHPELADEPQQIGTDTDWADVCGGARHVIGRREDGSLWGYGVNVFGTVGVGHSDPVTDPTTLATGETWTDLSCGTEHTLALASDGSLSAWGRNPVGQLGDGTTADRDAPVAVADGTSWDTIAAGSEHNVAIASDGTLWAWGQNLRGQVGNGCTVGDDCADVLEPVQIGTRDDWTDVAAGGAHSLGLTSGGEVFAWGAAGSGQLGDGTGGPILTATPL